MFTCIEFNLAVMQHYSLYTAGFITHSEWMLERQRLSYAFHNA